MNDRDNHEIRVIKIVLFGVIASLTIMASCSVVVWG